MAQAVINTYGTGLDTSAIIPRLNQVQATLLVCVVATVLVYVGHFYSAIAGIIAAILYPLARRVFPEPAELFAPRRPVQSRRRV
jgi:purine-cytosine permease-like protein